MKIIVVIGLPASGKEQPISEAVLTPNGWSSMGDLKINDYVIGSNGLPTKVLGIYPQGVKDVYTVTTKDGVKIRCGENHLWSVYHSIHSKPKLIIRTTNELINRGVIKPCGRPRYTLPIFNGLQNELDVNYSYALGYCLGNGCFTKDCLFISYDLKVESNILNLLEPSLGQPTNSRNNGGNSNQSSYSWRNIHPEIAKYRNSGKSGDKHLLKEHSNWLTWNYNSRLELLKGLLDSDGCVGKNGASNNFSSTSINLITLVRDLIRSLGGRCCEPYKDNRTHYKSGSCWSLAFRMPICPFKLKADNWKASVISMSSSIISIVKEDYKEESVCIKVDAPDELYVTTGFKLTHNTHYCELLNLDFHGVIVDDNLIDNNRNIIIDLIQDGRNFIYVDAALCNLDVLNKFKEFIDCVKDTHRIEEVEYIYFENNPEQCLINAANPNRVGKKVNRYIDYLTLIYKIPEGVVPLKVYRAKEAIEESGT
jgi:hypothetical protein